MFHFRIHGPRYAVLEQDVWYEVTEIFLPEGIPPSDLKVTWYKDNIKIPLLPEENQYRLDLWDVGYPAEGTYYAVAEVISTGATAKSNDIYLEIGAEYRQCKVSVKSRSVVKADIGDTVSFSPVCITYPDYAHRQCIWYKDGVALGPDEYIDVKINSEADYGLYDLKTHAWAHGGWEDTNIETLLDIIPKDEDKDNCKIKYIHDLLPARDAGFIWVGWWVIDEIMKANNEGFDWMAEPSDKRFKYSCDLKTLIYGFTKWKDLEIQESRNGYILNKKDLI